MVRERHGEKVSSLERLNKLFVRDCRAQRSERAAQLSCKTKVSGVEA